MSLIRLVNVSKIYNSSTYALNNVSLEVSTGSMIAIMGPSGSGKSTLLNIIGCLDNSTSGDYFFEGMHINKISKTDLAKIRNQKIGFIYQQFALLHEYTALENVEMPLIYGNFFKNFSDKLSLKEIRRQAEQKLSEVGLYEHLNKKPSQLSGGQQQRVAIARALVNEQPILLADEPTGSLDENTGNEIMNILKKINENGKTVIIVTHDERIARYCKQKIVVKDGKIYDSAFEESCEYNK